MKIFRQVATIVVLVIVIGITFYYINQKNDLSSLPIDDDTTGISNQGKLVDYQNNLPAGSQIYETDVANSRLQWTGSNIVGKEYYGTAGILTGVFIVNSDNEVTSGQFVIDMDDITVDNISDPKSNTTMVGHLKNEDFFLVEDYPVSSLLTTAVASELTENHTHLITGDLKIKDRVKSITFPATIAVADSELTAEAEFTIDRTDWGITYGSDKFFKNLGDKVISDDIKFKINLVAYPD